MFFFVFVYNWQFLDLSEAIALYSIRLNYGFYEDVIIHIVFLFKYCTPVNCEPYKDH